MKTHHNAKTERTEKVAFAGLRPKKKLRLIQITFVDIILKINNFEQCIVR